MKANRDLGKLSRPALRRRRQGLEVRKHLECISEINRELLRYSLCGLNLAVLQHMPVEVNR